MFTFPAGVGTTVEAAEAKVWAITVRLTGGPACWHLDGGHHDHDGDYLDDYVVWTPSGHVVVIIMIMMVINTKIIILIAMLTRGQPCCQHCVKNVDNTMLTPSGYDHDGF